jgi:hypothetical protein
MYPIAQRGTDEQRNILMVRFRIGDCVCREMRPEAGYVALLVVVPNQHQLQIFDEYEVDFGANGILIAYDSQLQAA